MFSWKSPNYCFKQYLFFPGNLEFTHAFKRWKLYSLFQKLYDIISALFNLIPRSSPHIQQEILEYNYGTEHDQLTQIPVLSSYENVAVILKGFSCCFFHFQPNFANPALD